VLEGGGEDLGGGVELVVVALGVRGLGADLVEELGEGGLGDVHDVDGLARVLGVGLGAEAGHAGGERGGGALDGGGDVLDGEAGGVVGDEGVLARPGFGEALHGPCVLRKRLLLLLVDVLGARLRDVARHL